jgi:hypothetical protein
VASLCLLFVHVCWLCVCVCVLCCCCCCASQHLFSSRQSQEGHSSTVSVFTIYIVSTHVSLTRSLTFFLLFSLSLIQSFMLVPSWAGNADHYWAATENTLLTRSNRSLVFAIILFFFFFFFLINEKININICIEKEENKKKKEKQKRKREREREALIIWNN